MQERQTLLELCKKYELHPNQITQWKKQLKEQSIEVFKDPNNDKDEKDKLIEQLYKTIGELTMDVDFLKNCFHEQGGAMRDGRRRGKTLHPSAVHTAWTMPFHVLLHTIDRERI